VTSRRAASREGFAARLAEGPFGALRGHVDSGRLGGSGPRSGPCSGTGAWPPPTWRGRPGCCGGPRTPVSAPCYATADLEAQAQDRGFP